MQYAVPLAGGVPSGQARYDPSPQAAGPCSDMALHMAPTRTGDTIGLSIMLGWPGG